MKCKYGTTWLTGTAWQEGCGHITWSAEQTVDIFNVIGSTNRRVVGRGNVSDVLPIPISLSFTTPEAALQYCATLPWSLPTQGELILEDNTLRITFAKAAFQNVKRTRNGSSVLLEYEFVVQGAPVVETFDPNAAPEQAIAFTFTGLTLQPRVFTPYPNVANAPAGALLSAVEINAVFGGTSIGGSTYADDFCIYAGSTAPTQAEQRPAGGQLQVGGALLFLPLNVTGRRFFYSNGGSSDVGTIVNDVVDVAYLNLGLSSTTFFYGCGWNEVGIWTGYVKLHYTLP